MINKFIVCSTPLINIGKTEGIKDIGSHFWNAGRTEEIKERYVHIDDHEA